MRFLIKLNVGEIPTRANNYMAYITEGDLENHILQDIDSSYSAWITTIITMVEAYIEEYCGIDFENGTSSERFFDGTGDEEVFIGPVQSIGSVKILDTSGNTLSTLGSGDWRLYPLNSSSPSIIKLSGGGSYSSFPGGDSRVSVTAVWGYATPPLPIKMAAIQLAAKLINEGLRGGQVSAESLGSYSIDYREVDEVSESMGIKNTLNLYRIMTLE